MTVASLLLCVAGMALTVVEAPCSKVGAYLLLLALLLGAQAACAYLVRAFLARPVRSFVAFLAVTLVCAIEYFVYYTFTPLLCRGA